ncbi:MAG: GTPase HflX [Clostridia bacterium]|nr:GTPase HflX [Clostridia bacterium]MBR3863338.1 GTPase HflX [Clostridia bacterium]
MENQITEGVRAALVSVVTRGTAEDAEVSLAELERLLDTAGGVTVFKMIQNKEAPDVRTYLGSGKTAELAFYVARNEVTLVVFDCELSPSQIRNLEEALGDKVRVIDRSMLILDIFALHAASGEGKLQVELAQLKYTAPRLMGKGTELSRLGGGIGTRGPGESQLETDRRHLQRRIRMLEQSLAEMAENRRTQRVARDRSGQARVAIVGYTNAGKSTLLNYLTDAGILAENKLFATLDPTTRKCRLLGGETILLTDTVGFIRNLPHHLIHAFRSTLDEAVNADLLLIMVDASDAQAASQIEVTEALLQDLGAGDKPVLYVFNKCDLGVAIPGAVHGRENVIYISAATGQGVERLLVRIEEMLHEGSRRVTFRIPNDKQGVLSVLYRNATVEDIQYGADAAVVTAVVDARVYGQLRVYDIDPPKEIEEW